MCEYCSSEGCICGSSDDKIQSLCECEVIGVPKCSRCGCEAQPWWSDIKIPGGQSVTDLIWDLTGDETYFPATKNKLVQTLTDSEQDGNWLRQNLPDQAYRNTEDIVTALISKMAPIVSEQQPTDIIWKYPGEALCGGQQLIIAENQQAALVSKTGRCCDIFTVGKYTISMENCPLLAAQSRKSLGGFGHVVLNGSAVFFSPSKEFELSLSVMGQTRALRRVMARCVARVRISIPKQFFEQIAAKCQYNSQGTITALQRYCDEILKKEMLAHEMDELTANSSLLEKSLNDGLKAAGLEPLKISFSSVGEFGPGMFMPPGAKMGDPKSYEQIKQMAESMRAAQISQMQAKRQQLTPQEHQQTQSVPQAATASSSGIQTIACPNCNNSNPQTSKFCGNCGKPLQPQKKVCPGCGHQSDPSIKFCGNCGMHLE